MLVNDCKRNCYLAAALTGLIIGLLSMGRAGFFGGLALGVMVAVIVGAILVWGLCNGRGGKVEDAETLRPDLDRTDDVAAGVSPLAQRVEAQLVAGGAAVAGYAAGLACKPGAVPLKAASDEVVVRPVAVAEPVEVAQPVEETKALAPARVVVQENAPEAAPVDAVTAEATAPVVPAKKAKKPKKSKDDKPAKAEKVKAESAKSDKPKRKKAEKEAKPEKADKNSRVKKLEKALKAVKAEKPAKVGKTKGGGKSAKASRDALAAEVQPMAQAAAPVPEKESRPDATPRVGKPATSDAKLRAGKTETAPDNLKEIKGVGPALESLLHENGVTRFAQIAAWGEAEIDAFAEKIGRNGGRIRNDDWIGQARTLAQGGETEFSRRVDKGEVY